MNQALETITRTPAPVAVSDATLTLFQDSITPNTRRAYVGALRRLDRSLDGQPLTDQSLADYLGRLDIQGRAPSTASAVVAAARFRARIAGKPTPAGPLTERALRGFHREGRTERGRGQSAPLTYDDVLTMQAKADEPRKRGRGQSRETTKQAVSRGRVDRALIGVLFQGGLRRSEAAALEGRDLKPGTEPGTMLITVRRSKTNQDGAASDVRLTKNGTAAALDAIRGADDAPVFGGLSPQSINNRVQALARHAGLDARITAHSARIGLASELTRRGASTTETMLAGNWKTSRMVAHYSAGAKAERGAVAKYL